MGFPEKSELDGFDFYSIRPRCQVRKYVIRLCGGRTQDGPAPGGSGIVRGHLQWHDFTETMNGIFLLLQRTSYVGDVRFGLWGGTH